MAQATNGTKLFAKKKTDTDFINIPGMKDFTDLGSKAERIEITALDSPCKSYIRGIQDTPELEFTFNYENPTTGTTAYTICKGLSAESNPVDFKLVFPDGSYYSWSGQCSVYVKAGKVNAALDFHLGVTSMTQLILNNATVA